MTLSPADARAYAADRSLVDLLGFQPQVAANGCQWRNGNCTHKSDAADAAAWVIAAESMRLRCGKNAARVRDGWEARACGEPTKVASAEISAFVEPSFGLRGKPTSVQHVQGHVAEVAWSLFVDATQGDGRVVVFRTYPDADVTSPGGDGYVVYLNDQDELASVLWEIKKRDGDDNVNKTIGTAYRQLKAKAPRYLAKIAGSAEPDDSSVGDFVGYAVAHWQAGHSTTAPAVAVACDNAGAAPTAFGTFHKHFPQFAKRWEGCIAGLGELDEFANQVREYVWTGL